MDFFKIITPVTYWILAIIWTSIFVFYIRKLYYQKAVDPFLSILLIILAIDAFRTLFESFYFGAWFTSLSELIPISIYNYLAQPQIVFIPKLINLITSILVLVIIIRKWLPMEITRIETYNALLAEKTKRIEAAKEKYKLEAKSSNEIAEHYRQLTINAPFPIMIHAEDGEVLLINNSWTEITGYTLKEINTISKWTQKAYGENAGSLIEYIDKLYQIGSALKEGEFTINTKTGDKVIWDFSSAPLEKLSDGRRMVISTAVDVTVKKQVENELKRHKQNLTLLVEERTANLEAKHEELKTKNKELEKYNQLFVDREFRIKELKEEIKKHENE